SKEKARVNSNTNGAIATLSLPPLYEAPQGLCLANRIAVPVSPIKLKKDSSSCLDLVPKRHQPISQTASSNSQVLITYAICRSNAGRRAPSITQTLTDSTIARPISAVCIAAPEPIKATSKDCFTDFK